MSIEASRLSDLENLILEHLRAIRARVEQHSEEFTFLKERMTSIEKQPERA